jgi:uncharacterized protein (TIGR03118 family)
MYIRQSLDCLAKAAFASALIFAPAALHADSFTQTNLVSNVPGMAAVTDSNLKNPWGVSFSATSPFWVSNQVTGNATLYNGAGAITALVVAIPGGNPTGQVNNAAGAGNFLVNGAAANFIFDTLNGTIAAWNGSAGTTAVQMAATPGAAYTGLAMATSGGTPYIYAADSLGSIHVFNSGWTDVTGTTFAGKFVDPNPMAGFTPYNIQLIGSNLYVTFAGTSGGYIDVFDTSGNFIKRFTTGGLLDSPWGLVIAPPGFGSFGNDLLVGNEDSGEILAYDPNSGTFLGTIDGPDGKPLVNDGLWSLEVRTGGTGNDLGAVYFTAGINDEQDGLFGKIDPAAVPEPASIVGTATGMIGLVLLRFRSRNKPA